MKSTTATLVFCFGLSLANAQHLKETDVPKKIKDSFAVQFPASKVSVWEKEGEDYEAEF